VADFDVTAPDGRTFTVTAPDGATQDQVLAYAQQEYAKMPKPQKSVLDKALESVNATLSLPAIGAQKVLSGIEKASQAVGGAVTDTLAQHGSPRFPVSPEAAAGFGTAANLGTSMALGGGFGSAAKPVLREGAERTMQSALKPSAQALENVGPTGPNATRAMKTLLDSESGGIGVTGYNVSRGGIASMQGKVDALKSSIDDALKGSGATVDKSAIASRLDDFTKYIKETDLAPQERLAALEKLKDQIVTNIHMPDKIPVAQAQRIKQAIYARLKDAYGELGSDFVQAQKYLARGAKDEIAAAVPEVAGLNAKEAELINALELAKHRAFITGNKDIGGLAWLTANPAQFAAFMADRSPLFKSILARIMNTGAQNAPAIGAATGAAVLPQGPQ